MLMMLLAMVSNKGTKDTDLSGHRKQKGSNRLEVTRIKILGSPEVPPTENHGNILDVGCKAEY